MPNPKARPHKLTEEEQRTAVKLYKSGYSLAQVGLQLGVTAPTILAYLKAKGVARRPVGRRKGKGV